MKKLYDFFKPDKGWQIPAIIVLGAMIGLGVYTAKISNFTSYLGDDPKTCVNCHVMTPEYNTWAKSSHKNVATCNDCHVPHDNIFRKYYFKAKDGLRHATMFTFRMEPQNIVMHEAGQEVVHENCVRCHSNQVRDYKLEASVANLEVHRTDRQCWECHREVPHGRVKSLSSVPYGKVNHEPVKVVPDWIKEKINTQYSEK
ncbi:MAG: cytochrome c nitrite reductase small subunit [Ichthyobacteriaceae bacterium]|nr:cytochrome c nitrite reductase small subunit [Ichthyobacteriaceae bacterium]